jgi:hypothetical protein
VSTQYRLVQSGKTASGGCSAGPRFVRAVAPRIIIIIIPVQWSYKVNIKRLQPMCVDFGGKLEFEVRVQLAAGFSLYFYVHPKAEQRISFAGFENSITR